MKLKFKEDAQGRIYVALIHTALGSGGINRSVRRHLKRLASKFAPEAKAVWLKPGERADLARILKGYLEYLRNTEADGEENQAKRMEATTCLAASVEKLEV